MSTRKSNRLISESSPYLMQHAHNPVDWYPWGREALDRARQEGRPIFLSIGYAACHWCHVMEHESFEDEDIAASLNRHFVCIKVDREERPDLDEIYMQATVLYSQGHGGWPMSVFLTPDMKPFFAGTYFPPRDAYGRIGFATLLERIAEAWQQSPEKLRSDAEQITAMIRQMHMSEPSGGMLSKTALSSVIRRMVDAYDMDKGGLRSGSNKFPPSMSMDLFLREHRDTGNGRLLDAVTTTLDRMAWGGIYDHLGGGICRYSTDPNWLVPHFEKMLYDQALVSSVYLDGYQVTGKPLYASTARGILDYVLRDLRSDQGGFYSSEDADSEGKEGKFYLWTLEEVQHVLGEEDARLFAACYDVTAQGNWHHPGDDHVPHGPKNILRIPRPLEVVAKLHDLTTAELEEQMTSCRRALFEARKSRVRPGLDDKILADWNGLMIAGLVKGGVVLGESKYLTAAESAAAFVLDAMIVDGRLYHGYGKGNARLTAYCSDYAFMIEALLNLFEATGSARWLLAAESLMETAVNYYWDQKDGGFFFTASDHEALIHRSKSAVDNAIPSGNSVMLSNLLRMAALTGRHDARDKAAAIVAGFGAAIEKAPFAHDRLAAGIHAWHGGLDEIVIVGSRDSEITREFVRAVHDRYIPTKVVVVHDPGDTGSIQLRRRLPLLAHRVEGHSETRAYLCRDGACAMPATDVAMLKAQLDGLRSGPHA